MEFIDPYMNYIIIAALAIGVVILLVTVSRAFGGRVRGRRGKRLAVSEYRELDQTRRLMLVRRDDVEHLILVGGGQSLVIEQNIGLNPQEDYASAPLQFPEPAAPPPPPPPPPHETQQQPEFDSEPVHRPAPRAPAFSDRAPNVRPIQRETPQFGRSDEF